MDGTGYSLPLRVLVLVVLLLLEPDLPECSLLLVIKATIPDFPLFLSYLFPFFSLPTNHRCRYRKESIVNFASVPSFSLPYFASPLHSFSGHSFSHDQTQHIIHLNLLYSITYAISS